MWRQSVQANKNAEESCAYQRDCAMKWLKTNFKQNLDKSQSTSKKQRTVKLKSCTHKISIDAKKVVVFQA